MIEVSLSGAFLIYLFIPVSVIILMWFSTEYQLRTYATQVEQINTMQCQLCLCSFIFDRNLDIVECPHCHTLNDVIRNSEKEKNGKQ